MHSTCSMVLVDRNRPLPRTPLDRAPAALAEMPPPLRALIEPFLPDGFARTTGGAAAPARAASEAPVEAPPALAREARARRQSEADLEARRARPRKDGSIRLGDQGQHVRTVEQRLQRLGYDVGAVDGRYDRDTAAAVNAFRRDQDIDARSTTLGKRGREVLADETRALSHDPERRRRKPTREGRQLDARVGRAAREIRPGGTTGIGEGDRGGHVKWVQQHLRAAGYDPKRTDGRFDERTRGALEQFQRRSELPVTGRVDAATWRKLQRSTLEARDGVHPPQREGERSSAVKRSEKMLEKLGFNPGKIDGLYTEQTQRAVDAFRKKKRLGDLGSGVGERVDRAMRKAIRAQTVRGLPTSPKAFIRAIAPGASSTDRSLGVPASVTIAQAILESGWGKSSLAQRANNLFGIKGRGPAGSITLPTREVINGQSVIVRAKFRRYHNPAESIRDHGKLLANSSYYREAMRKRNDPRAFAHALTGVYATDPNYGRLLVSIMDQYNLYRFNRR